MKGKKAGKERRSSARGRWLIVAKKFSSCLFNMIPTCPREAHKAQLKGRKVETKRIYFKGLFLALRGESKNKEDFFFFLIQLFLAS